MNAPVSGPADSTPPSAPASLSATGSLGKVSLSWSAATDNVGVSGYEVYRSTTPGFTPGAANRIATPTATSYVDTVAAGTYYYRVKAIDAAGNLGGPSPEASATATADTTPPTVSVTAPAAGTVSGTVTLRATASDEVGVAGVQFLVDGAGVRSRGHQRALRNPVAQHLGAERPAHDRRPRPRRRRQHQNLRRRRGHGQQPARQRPRPRLRVRRGLWHRRHRLLPLPQQRDPQSVRPGPRAANTVARSASTAPATASTSPTRPRST